MLRNTLLVLFITLSITSVLFAQSNCYECHGEMDFTRTNEAGDEESMFVADSIFVGSVHGDFDCVDCHADAVGDPHPDELEKVNCGVCHEDDHELFQAGLHGQKLLSGDDCAPTCASCHGKHDILSSADEKSRTHSINLVATCSACHKKDGPACLDRFGVSQPVERFDDGVHGEALAQGNEEAASCNDCHGSHLLLPRSNPQSKIFQLNISSTCGECHTDVAEEYNNSSHGKALAAGEFEAPTCITCHGEHEILSPSDEASPTHAHNIANQTCEPCHGSVKLNEKYGLLPDPTRSYENSYHGLASARGSKVAANCTSCHGVHNIMGVNDPESTIYPANLAETCGSCHPNASEEFSKSYVHEKAGSFDDIVSNIIKKIYKWMIVLVIGGMILHNFIIWLSYVRKKYRFLKQQETIQRFDRHWVIQHVSTFLSFTTLVVTGFALKFPDAGWVQLLTELGLSEIVRSVLHRIAAVVLIAAAVYQWVYLLFMKKWKGELQTLLPTFTDAREFVQHMGYHLGFKTPMPEFSRYSYIEKAEFWALIWGNIVMMLTGLVLWFPTVALSIFPSWSWLIKVSETVHYYEAWLAALAIFFYHMFFAIFHPEDYPINLAGFTGKITEEEAKERFPRWYRKVMRSRTSAKQESESEDSEN